MGHAKSLKRNEVRKMTQDQEAVAKIKLEEVKVRQQTQTDMHEQAKEREEERHKNIMEEITKLKDAKVTHFHREENKRIGNYKEKQKEKKECCKCKPKETETQ